MRKPITHKGNPKFSLLPLVTNGRKSTAWSDVGGIESVVLTRIEYFLEGPPWQRVSHYAEDIFSLSELDLFEWPLVEELTEAEFTIRTRCAGSRRAGATRVIIQLPDALCTCRWGGDPLSMEEQRALNAWLKNRGFMSAEGHAIGVDVCD